MNSPPPPGVPGDSGGKDWQKIGAILAGIALMIGLVTWGIDRSLDDGGGGTNYNGNNNNCVAQGEGNTVTCDRP